MIGINVLQLQYLEKATKEDEDNDLVYWAKLFKASTWEEIQNLAQEREDIEEVADMIFTLNTDNHAKEILEGQRRYREQLASQYAAGRIDAQEEYREKLQEKDKTIEEKDKTIEEKDSLLDAANQTIEELQKRIKELEENK